MESDNDKPEKTNTDWIIGIVFSILFIALFCATVFSSFIGHPIFGG